jgi:hypothetical protein
MFREIVAFSRREPPQAAEQYRQLLTSIELPLTAGSELPAGALRC